MSASFELPLALPRAPTPSSDPARLPDADRRWFQMFGPPPREHGFEPLRVEGAIPEGLRVSVYFNGPGHFARYGRRYGHWFDGDGTLAAVRLAGGRAEGAYRTTRTRERRIEDALGRSLFGAFGTPNAWPLTLLPPALRIKASANTAVLCRDGKVFALMEGTPPLQVDPHTLLAQGPTDLGVSEMRTYGAHPIRLPDGRVINTGLRVSKTDHVDLFETAGDRTRRLVEVPIDEATLVHAFAATPRYAVLLLMPLHLDKLRFLLNLGAFFDNLRWRPERGTELVIVPLDAPERLQRLTIDPFFFWHVAQCFERGEQIHVDLVRYADPENAAWLGTLPHGGAAPVDGGALHRVVIDPSAGRARLEPRADVLAEFPMTSPACRGREARYVFCGTDRTGRMSGPVDGLVKIDAQRGTHEPIALDAEEPYPSEVLVVPRGEGSDDAWLLTMVYEASRHRSFLAVLDARAPAAGPLAKCWFDHHVPGRFHGDYLPL